MNTILLRPMKSRTNPDIVEVFISVYDKMKTRGHQLKHHMINNDAPAQSSSSWRRKKSQDRMWKPTVTR